MVRIHTLSDTHPVRSILGGPLLKKARPHARSVARMSPAVESKTKGAIMEVAYNLPLGVEELRATPPEAEPGWRLMDRFAAQVQFLNPPSGFDQEE